MKARLGCWTRTISIVNYVQITFVNGTISTLYLSWLWCQNYKNPRSCFFYEIYQDKLWWFCKSFTSQIYPAVFVARLVNILPRSVWTVDHNNSTNFLQSEYYTVNPCRSLILGSTSWDSCRTTRSQGSTPSHCWHWTATRWTPSQRRPSLTSTARWGASAWAGGSSPATAGSSGSQPGSESMICK